MNVFSRPRSTAAVWVVAWAFFSQAAWAAAGRVPAPRELRAVYLTYWSAASENKLAELVDMARSGLVNGVVIDLKDASGRVAFDTWVPQAAHYGAREIILADLDALVGRLRAEGLYVIARIVLFADPRLAAARPDLAVHSVSSLAEPGPPALWRDHRGLAWIDPASTEAWDYNLAIARDAWSRGFDEINFDYVRFPSDGVLAEMSFPVWRGTGPRHDVLRRFFSHARVQMGEAVISADLFGLSTVNRDDLGVGQLIEDALEQLDYVCPMVYPSHYAPGFLGLLNPAEHPYDVVLHSLSEARSRLDAMGFRARARLRPWVQSFHLGAEYTPEMVYDQVRATRDALGAAYTGFLLWNPRNVYSREALALAAQD